MNFCDWLEDCMLSPCWRGNITLYMDKKIDKIRVCFDGNKDDIQGCITADRSLAAERRA